jgi:hypothetical protein
VSEITKEELEEFFDEANHLKTINLSQVGSGERVSLGHDRYPVSVELLYQMFRARFMHELKEELKEALCDFIDEVDSEDNL